MSQAFQALVVRESGDNKFKRSIEKRSLNDLPEGEILIRVHFSSLNYKDGLSCTGNRGVTRHYPHTPGIDAAGVVESSDSGVFNPGDHVLVTSQDLGMNTPGGFGQFIRVPSNWVMPVPEGMSLRESMIFGTAGFTAGLSIKILQKIGVEPEKGPILVTGSSGGVGSVSVAILSKLGYSVIASTMKPDVEEFLKELGASEVIGTDTLKDKYGKPLLKETWGGAIDTLGGTTLASILKSCLEGGAVVATGMVDSTDLPTTVFPFILRGVSLLGVNSQSAGLSVRKEIWNKLAEEWKPEVLENLALDCKLENLNYEIDRILNGNQRGRVVIDLR